MYSNHEYNTSYYRIIRCFLNESYGIFASSKYIYRCILFPFRLGECNTYFFILSCLCHYGTRTQYRGLHLLAQKTKQIFFSIFDSYRFRNARLSRHDYLRHFRLETINFLLKSHEHQRAIPSNPAAPFSNLCHSLRDTQLSLYDALRCALAILLLGCTAQIGKIICLSMVRHTDDCSGLACFPRPVHQSLPPVAPAGRSSLLVSDVALRLCNQRIGHHVRIPACPSISYARRRHQTLTLPSPLFPDALSPSQLCLSNKASSSHAFRAGGLRLHPVSFPEALCA